MGYGDVKQRFEKGDLNELWYYVELCKLRLPDTDGARIVKLRDSLVRYSLISPWPMPDGAEPESFMVRFFADEHADFYYYLGLGYGIDALILGTVIERNALYDIEGEITANCLKRAPKADKDELRKKRLEERGYVIDYLEAMGDTDKVSII